MCACRHTATFSTPPVTDRHAIIGVHAGDLILSDEEANAAAASSRVVSSSATANRLAWFSFRSPLLTPEEQLEREFLIASRRSRGPDAGLTPNGSWSIDCANVNGAREINLPRLASAWANLNQFYSQENRSCSKKFAVRCQSIVFESRRKSRSR